MCVVGVSVNQSNSHTVIACLRNLICNGFYCANIQFNQYIAQCVHAFRHGVTHIAWQQWCRQIEVQVVLLKARFRAHLDDIAKSLRGDQGGFGATSLY